jgi:predicted RNase H-like HicB family nuclease
MNLTMEVESEHDERWVAEVPELPCVLAYGADRNEAISRTQVLGLRVIAERRQHGEALRRSIRMSVPA